MELWSWFRRPRVSAKAAAPELRSTTGTTTQLPSRVLRESFDESPRVPQPAADDNAPVDEWLRAQLAAALRNLDAQTVGDERTPAFLTLMGHLAGDPEGRLRRPPTAAQRAMSVCQREDTSIETVVAVLENDPALTQAMLQRANSAYYSRGGPPCLSLADAILRLGRKSVHNVLIEQTMGALIYAGAGTTQLMVGAVWSHSVRTAPLARGLAPVFGVEPEKAFALALLHDVGKLAIFDRMGTLRTQLRTEFSLPPGSLSRILRLLHEPLGGLCALGWQFGDDAARAIARHHRDPVPATPDPMTDVLWLAERIDITQTRKEPIDIQALWASGALAGDPAAAARVLTDLHSA